MDRRKGSFWQALFPRRDRFSLQELGCAPAPAPAPAPLSRQAVPVASCQQRDRHLLLLASSAAAEEAGGVLLDGVVRLELPEARKLPCGSHLIAFTSLECQAVPVASCRPRDRHRLLLLAPSAAAEEAGGGAGRPPAPWPPRPPPPRAAPGGRGARGRPGGP